MVSGWKWNKYCTFAPKIGFLGEKQEQHNQNSTTNIVR